MSLSKEYYYLNGLKGRLFYGLHEFSYIVEHNVFRMRMLRPAFLDLIRTDSINGSGLVGVEIGVDEGKNAFSMLKYLPIRKLFLVDPYVDYMDHGRLIVSGESNFNYARRLLRGCSGRVEFIRALSEDAVDLIPDGLDFVYLDGNHDYDFVKKDIELYSKKLHVGGFLCFDDTGFFSVSKAIVECVDAGGFVPVDGCVNCLRRVEWC